HVLRPEEHSGGQLHPVLDQFVAAVGGLRVRARASEREPHREAGREHHGPDKQRAPRRGAARRRRRQTSEPVQEDQRGDGGQDVAHGRRLYIIPRRRAAADAIARSLAVAMASLFIGRLENVPKPQSGLRKIASGAKKRSASSTACWISSSVSTRST